RPASGARRRGGGGRRRDRRSTCDLRAGGKSVMTASPDELRTRFGGVYTAALTDVLDGLGHRHQTLPPEVVPLEPGGARIAGPAFAVEGPTNHSIDVGVSIR